MQISIVGLGLIGASFAKSIKKNTNHIVVGHDINENVLNSAISDKAIDKIGDLIDISTADLTIFAIYPKDTIDFIKKNAALFKKGSVVIDTCGIKRKICEQIAPVAEKNGFEFIGAHPMAGKEKNGYDYSDSDLFLNASMILTPFHYSENVKMLFDLSQLLKFKEVKITSPEEHDRIIAYTSQLPHVLACAYILDPDAKLHHGFSAGSYKDVSRVATINADLWNELFIENKDFLSGHIKLLIKNLEKLDSFIENTNSESLSKMLDDGDKIKRTIG